MKPSLSERLLILAIVVPAVVLLYILAVTIFVAGE